MIEKLILNSRTSPLCDAMSPKFGLRMKSHLKNYSRMYQDQVAFNCKAHNCGAKQLDYDVNLQRRLLYSERDALV